MHITASIVTYNRLEFLKKIITALQNQSRKPDRIVVVNNSSSDGTLEYLNSLTDIEVITQENSGSSGGQFTSAKYCYETGSEWIWLMDDDVVPRNNCLEILSANAEKDCIYAALRINPDGKVNQGDTLLLNFNNPFKSIWRKIIDSEMPNRNIIDAQGLTFEGPLFHRNLISKIGLPEYGFFIYGDDTDFFSRAYKAGFKGFIKSDAIIDRLLPVPQIDKFDWKTYYIIRNIIVIDVLNAPLFVRIIRPFAYLLSWIVRARNINDIRTVFKAFLDGYFYKQSEMNKLFNKANNIVNM